MCVWLGGGGGGGDKHVKIALAIGPHHDMRLTDPKFKIKSHILTTHFAIEIASQG